ncbi:FAD-binding oxidoreductase [Geodermatophilus amargosae]|uniref:FAD-binding oxidoreductase n=1 Tax=Geodermatophilus amargosae TaxID=1296565 RepID=UPI0034DFC482
MTLSPPESGVHDPARLLRSLGALPAGALALPADEAYRAVTSLSPSGPCEPCAVVTPATAADVAAVVRAAGASGLRVAVRRTGHGAVPVAGDTVLVSTALLDECAVDVERRSARIGAGTTWQQVLDAATPHDLAPVCGAAPGIGVVGYLTGGGIGPLARTHGVSSDYVRALEVVTGDGQLRRATPTEHPDLFWGLRGGKATLGIVTAVEVDLVPLASVYGGCLWFDGADAPAILRAWRRLCEDLPEEGTTSLALMHLPPLPHVPAPLAGRRTVAVRFAWTGAPTDADRLLADLRAAAPPVAGDVTVLPYAAIGSIHADPVELLPTREHTLLLSSFPQEAADALLSAVGADSPQTMVELRQLGGAVARAPRHPSAVSHRDAAVNVFTVGMPSSGDPAAVDRHAERVLDALTPFAYGGTLANFSADDSPAVVARSFSPAALRRLTALGDRYDPHGVLRTGQVARSPLAGS